MKFLLTGGSANGKSTLGEKMALDLTGPHYYLAAMRPYGPESFERIARHRASHNRKGFITIERYTALDTLCLPKRGTVLLECLCNLLDNELFSHNSHFKSINVVEQIFQGLESISNQCDNLLVVTNDVGSDWPSYPPSTLQYAAKLGQLNCLAAAFADAVLEVVAGIPLLRRGTLNSPLMKYLENSGKGDSHMILVIGAEASGKRTFVKELGFQEAEMSPILEDACPVLTDLHRVVAQDPLHCGELLPKLLHKKVVICNEVGSGIIPDTPQGRLAREQTGRMCVLLAQEAARVVRMVCGIPTILK